MKTQPKDLILSCPHCLQYFPAASTKPCPNPTLDQTPESTSQNTFPFFQHLCHLERGPFHPVRETNYLVLALRLENPNVPVSLKEVSKRNALSVFHIRTY